jgi:hypothetical protein
MYLEGVDLTSCLRGELELAGLLGGALRFLYLGFDRSDRF